MQSTKNKIESYPAPAQLATETDLSPHEVKAITEAVNPLIVDAFALYVKTKNFHWHLYGSHFRDYHLLLDEHALHVGSKFEETGFNAHTRPNDYARS
jgi:starvation-inducible DNA-binding protein